MLFPIKAVPRLITLMGNVFRKRRGAYRTAPDLSLIGMLDKATSPQPPAQGDVMLPYFRNPSPPSRIATTPTNPNPTLSDVADKFNFWSQLHKQIMGRKGL